MATPVTPNTNEYPNIQDPAALIGAENDSVTPTVPYDDNDDTLRELSTSTVEEVEPDPPIEDQKIIYTWVIEDFANQPPIGLFSPSFAAGPYYWSVNLFPAGNNKSDTLSIYLSQVDSPKYKKGAVSKTVHFAFTVINHLYPEKIKYKELMHEFGPTIDDWGLGRTLWRIEDVLDEDNGWLDNGALTVEMHVQIVRVENDDSSWKFSRGTYYDSKKETGFVGLTNQGATCYMNSLLQTLFFTAPLRKAVYRMEHVDNPEDLVEGEEEEEGKKKKRQPVAVALQQLFYRLQFGESACGTKGLTKSFGWNSFEAFVQHDVQELARVLLDNIESKMKGTPSESLVNDLYQGRALNYVRCLDVDYQSTRIEPYLDISLNVLGCKNVYESFNQYTEAEVLEGDNMYQAEGHGLQRAEKGISFLSFPPVLHLHLKRFEFDMERLTNYKVNDLYEFPMRLNVDDYLNSDAERSFPNDYELHAVMIHSGDVNGGHYYAFIRPGSDEDKWYKFDDEKVTIATRSEAVDANFGGSDGLKYTLAGKEYDNEYPSVTNAYMLVYVRSQEREEIMAPPTIDEIPTALQDSMQQKIDDEAEEKREKAEAYRYTDYKIVTGADFSKHHGSDMIDWARLPGVKLLSDCTVGEAKLTLADIYDVAPHRMRLWNFQTRSNSTIRVDKSIDDYDDVLLASVLGYSKKRLYLEIFDGDNHMVDVTPEMISNAGIDDKDENAIRRLRWPAMPSLFPQQIEGTALLFIKWYTPQCTDDSKLQYIGAIYVNVMAPISSILPLINDLRGVAEDPVLKIFEEITPNWIEPIYPVSRTLHDLELQTGDIIVAMEGDHRVDESGTVIKEDKSAKPGFYPDPDAYYEYLKKRVTVKFLKLEGYTEDEGFTIQLMSDMSYEDVALEVAAHLKLPDQWHLRLTSQSYRSMPRMYPVKARDNPRLEAMLTVAYHEPSSTTLYYEVLNESIIEMESWKTIKIPWYDQKVSLVKSVDVKVPFDGTIKDLVAALREAAPLETERNVVRVCDNWPQGFKVYEEDYKLDRVAEYYLRGEEVPDEELDIDTETQHLVTCKHINQDQYILRLFGATFKMVVTKGETLSSFKDRIKAKLQLSDDEFDKWKFSLCRYSSKDKEFAPDTVLGDVQFADYEYFGMEHVDKTPPPTASAFRGYGRKEQSIKIYH